MSDVIERIKDRIEKEAIAEDDVLYVNGDEFTFFIPIDTAERIIDEESAKEPVCVWEFDKIREHSMCSYNTSCGHADCYAFGVDLYCRHCGKKIEVK